MLCMNGYLRECVNVFYDNTDKVAACSAPFRPMPLKRPTGIVINSTSKKSTQRWAECCRFFATMEKRVRFIFFAPLWRLFSMPRKLNNNKKRVLLLSPKWYWRERSTKCSSSSSNALSIAQSTSDNFISNIHTIIIESARTHRRKLNASACGRTVICIDVVSVSRSSLRMIPNCIAVLVNSVTTTALACLRNKRLLRFQQHQRANLHRLRSFMQIDSIELVNRFVNYIFVDVSHWCASVDLVANGIDNKKRI